MQAACRRSKPEKIFYKLFKYIILSSSYLLSVEITAGAPKVDLLKFLCSDSELVNELSAADFPTVNDNLLAVKLLGGKANNL